MGAGESRGSQPRGLRRAFNQPFFAAIDAMV